MFIVADLVSLSDNRSWKPIVGLLLSDRLRQVLLYAISGKLSNAGPIVYVKHSDHNDMLVYTFKKKQHKNNNNITWPGPLIWKCFWSLPTAY